MGSREDDECIEWGKAHNKEGYGRKRVNGKLEYVHRLAFEEHNGRKPVGLVRHTCDNPKCYNPNHLIDGTHKQNSEDMVARGRSTRGERHRNVILGESDVREIRELYRGSGMMVKDIATLYGVKRQTITSIGKGKSWKHV